MSPISAPSVRAGFLGARELSISERNALVQTLDSWLRPGEEISLGEELPLIFGEGNAQHVFLEDEQGLLGHAATLPVEVDVQDRRYPVTLISSVGIRPDRRGRGWGQELLRACEAIAKPPFLLWSDRIGFYEKLGFRSFGSERLVVLSPLPLPQPDDNETRLGWIREADEQDIPGLELLHAGNRSFCRRSREHWDAFLKIPRVRIFLLMSRPTGGRPIAYAAMGKGMDFPNTIHELGGTPAALSELLARLPYHLGHELACLLPDEELIPRLPITRCQVRGFALAKGAERLPRDFYLGGFSSV